MNDIGQPALTTNPRTGLKEGFDAYYRVPLVYQRRASAIRVDGQLTAVHTVPLNRGLTLDFYARLGRSDELFVTLHGADRLESLRYPRFERVHSMRFSPAAMAFADPTMRLGLNHGMLLSWFLGGPGWDPNHAILMAVRKAMGKCGAKHVAFVGGSGGGFAALRLSAMVENSLAYVQDPQTRIAGYIPHVVAKYFEVVWPGWDRAKLLAAFPDRFDMPELYSHAVPRNFVYYAQNSSDVTHVANHYHPFRVALGLAEDRGITRDGRRNFALYDGERQGHGKITAEEYTHHLEQALTFWRGARA